MPIFTHFGHICYYFHDQYTMYLCIYAQNNKILIYINNWLAAYLGIYSIIVFTKAWFNTEFFVREGKDWSCEVYHTCMFLVGLWVFPHEIMVSKFVSGGFWGKRRLVAETLLHVEINLAWNLGSGISPPTVWNPERPHYGDSIWIVLVFDNWIVKFSCNLLCFFLTGSISNRLF